MTTLDREFQAYREALPSMLQKHEGQYVVIRDTELLDFFDSYEGALDWAYDRFGLDRFFVKKVAPDQATAQPTRTY